MPRDMSLKRRSLLPPDDVNEDTSDIAAACAEDMRNASCPEAQAPYLYNTIPTRQANIACRHCAKMENEQARYPKRKRKEINYRYDDEDSEHDDECDGDATEDEQPTKRVSEFMSSRGQAVDGASMAKAIFSSAESTHRDCRIRLTPGKRSNALNPRLQSHSPKRRSSPS